MEERLRKFAVLIHEGSFTQAARRLRVSQPALTTAVQKLERELKCELVVRSGHPVKATPAGQLVLAAAQTQQDNLSNLRARLAKLADDKPQLAIGFIDSVADLLLDGSDSLDKLFDNASVSLSINSSTQLLRGVEQDKLDMAFIARQDNPGVLADSFVGNEPMVLVCRPYIAPQVIAAIQKGSIPDFFSYNPSSTTERLVREQLEGRGLRTEASFYSTSPAVMLNLMLSRDSTAVLPYMLIRPYLESGRLTSPLPSLVIERPIHLITRVGRVLPEAAQALTDGVRRKLESLSEVCRLQFDA